MRHFSWPFRRRTGSTPAAYTEAVPLEAARRLLEDTEQSPPEVAAASGLGSVEALHRGLPPTPPAE